MNPHILLPLLVGVVAVFQPMLNRVILDTKGLSFAAWINSVVLLVIATLAVLVTYFFSEQMPEFMRPKMGTEWHWWFIVPGIFGYIIVFFLPLSMRSLGAFVTIVALLLGQLITSFLYDTLVYGKPITTARAFGLILTLAGAYLTFRPTE